MISSFLEQPFWANVSILVLALDEVVQIPQVDNDRAEISM
jgi:hypothetical protein